MMMMMMTFLITLTGRNAGGVKRESETNRAYSERLKKTVSRGHVTAGRRLCQSLVAEGDAQRERRVRD
jgi:hypothetical protein